MTISIHALREEGDQRGLDMFDRFYEISIHALHGEGDQIGYDHISLYYYISIHALHGEGDYATNRFIYRVWLFQSTPSTGRATENRLAHIA